MARTPREAIADTTTTRRPTAASSGGRRCSTRQASGRFRCSQTPSLLDISFHGVLHLPAIVVDDTTDYMLLNLMAFERLHAGAGNDVIAYVFFMDNIIDSARDVALLTSKGIIQNAVGSDKAVAKLFDGLSKDVSLDAVGELDPVQRMVNRYCRKPCNVWRANLVHTYFRSPWAFMSLAAAVLSMRNPADGAVSRKPRSACADLEGLLSFSAGPWPRRLLVLSRACQLV